MKRESYVFRGHHVGCSNSQPHPPHKVGEYDTVRYGELSKFCKGILADNECYEDYFYSVGCACTPTKFKCTILTFSSKEEKEEWEEAHPDRRIKTIPRHEGSCA